MTPLEITLFIALAYIIIGILLCIVDDDLLTRGELLRTVFLWPLLLIFAAVFWLIENTQVRNDE